jgi:diguanylate cyclase (GGDEF)-like protein
MERRLPSRCVLGVGAAVVVLAVIYGVSLLPGVRPHAGYLPALDGWLNAVVDGGVVLLLVIRGLADRRERTAWWFLAAGLACALGGSLAYYAHYQNLTPIPSPSWADAGWLGFYPLVYVALLLLLRSRVHRLLPSVWLDGLVTGLTAAAVAAAYLRGAAVPPTAGTAAGIAATVAYPVADLLLLVLVVGALTIVGRAGGLVLWLLGAGLAALVLTDAVYAAELAAGRYVAGGPLDLGWLIGRVCFTAAAVASLVHRRRSPEAHPEGVAVLVVPTICAVAVLVVLFHGTRTALPDTAEILALAAGLAVITRTAMTFREVRDVAEVRRQARTDELTGLANRRCFSEALQTATAASLVGRSVAVLILDLNRLKEVNDFLGHSAGDELLRLVGQRLQQVPREGDLLARLGGDEYALLVHDVSEAEAVDLAERLRETLRQPLPLASMSLTIDGSVGVALAPAHTTDAGDLLQLADLAMYAAKSRRAGVLVYDEARDATGRHRLELIEQLRKAIPDGQLVLHYQPQLDLRHGEVTGVEALVRWEHPIRGLLAPAAFVDLAESSGLMAPLTQAVLRSALEQCHRWHAEGLQLSVSVNVSPSTLMDHEFPNRVEALLTEHGVPPHALVLEVTEELLLQDRKRAAAVLTRLRAIGVRVSIDDYGTGYSSLAYLSDLPVNELKLDRAFITGLAADARRMAIVTSTVDLAHALGLEVVAEGVEDQRTLDALNRMRCELAQGYHLSRPVPAALIPSTLHQIRTDIASSVPHGR